MTWLVARVIRTRDERLWLVAGVVAGIALLNKPLIAFLLAGLGLGLVTAGPRRLLRSGWLWAWARHRCTAVVAVADLAGEPRLASA